MMRRTATGKFELPIRAVDAIGYFTPEGERAWVPGWEPHYPDGEASEADGTVFVTSHGDADTVWVIDRIDRIAATSAYSRLTMGHHAGTVKVYCADQGDDQCQVTVSYDMTSLAPHRPDMLDAYNEASFTAMMSEWATGVTAALNPDNHV